MVQFMIMSWKRDLQESRAGCLSGHEDLLKVICVRELRFEPKLMQDMRDG